MHTSLYAAIYDQSPVGLKFPAAFERLMKQVTFDQADAAASQEFAWQTSKGIRRLVNRRKMRLEIEQLQSGAAFQACDDNGCA